MFTVKKEGYLIFGKYPLNKDQIQTLSNPYENLVLVIFILFIIHLWLYLKESNPIFDTTEVSRYIEISLAVPVSFLAIIRCIECRRIPNSS